MKLRLFTSLFIIVLILNACKKDPVAFKYRNLASFDSTGKPTNLVKDSCSPALLSFAALSFPDHVNIVNADPQLFTSPQTADIAITATSDVYATFIGGNASSRNTLGFYTYPTNQPPSVPADIKFFTYIFPNTGGNTPLVAGDKVKIGTFNAGTTIGFILARGAWQPGSHTISNNTDQFFSTDILNPETDPTLKRHAIVINYPAENINLVGFEDTNRSSPNCDNDFNDVVFYCTVAPR